MLFYPIPQELPRDLLHQVAVLADEYNQNPILALSIINCESGFDPLATHLNVSSTTGKKLSTDTGYWQINSTHKDESMRRGFDIDNPMQNLEYGFLMMKDIGTAPWNASLNCWGPVLHN